MLGGMHISVFVFVLHDHPLTGYLKSSYDADLLTFYTYQKLLYVFMFVFTDNGYSINLARIRGKLPRMSSDLWLGPIHQCFGAHTSKDLILLPCNQPTGTGWMVLTMNAAIGLGLDMIVWRQRNFLHIPCSKWQIVDRLPVSYTHLTLPTNHRV